MNRVAVHPLTGLLFWRRWRFLLLLPLLRALLYDRGLTPLLVGEVLLLPALIAYGEGYRRALTVSVDTDAMHIAGGILVRHTAVIPRRAVDAVRMERTPVTAVFGAVKVTVLTGARRTFVFYLSEKETDGFLTALGRKHREATVCRVHPGRVALSALSNASALSGLLVAAGVIRKVGRLVDEESKVQMVDTVSHAAMFVQRFVPPVTTAVALLLVFGFCVSFLQRWGREFRFHTAKSKDGVTVYRGFWRRTETWLPAKGATVAVTRRPAMLALLGLCEVAHYRASRYRGNEDVPLLKPAKRAVSARCPSHAVPRRARARAVRLPCLLFVGLMLTVAAAIRLWPMLWGITVPAGLFGMSLLAFWLWIRVRHLRRGGVSFGNPVRAVGYRRLTALDATFERNAVDAVVITEGPFQRKRRLTTVRVYARSVTRFSVCVPNVETEQ